MNSEEIWKDILGYEGLYQVSSFGRVRSLDRYDRMNRFWKGRILKSYTDTVGYLDVRLCSNGKLKHHLVHRLVAEAFIPNPLDLPQVNHKDEVKSNNSVENLEWCDNSYNLNYGTRKDRIKDTAIKNGYWTGLSEEEYRKKYYKEHKNDYNEWRKDYRQKKKDKINEWQKEYYHKNRDKINEQRRENRRKKKEENIQNNVKSLDDQI